MKRDTKITSVPARAINARYKSAPCGVLRHGYEAMLNRVGAVNDFDNILIWGAAAFRELLRNHARELRLRLRMDGGSTFSNVRSFRVVADYSVNEASANR